MFKKISKFLSNIALKLKKVIIFILTFILVNCSTLLIYKAYADDGWRYVGGPSYTYSGSNSYNERADIGTTIMGRLRNSYTYKTRRPYLNSRAYMQILLNADKPYYNYTYTATPSSTYNGFTQWYDSPYGVWLDYETGLVEGNANGDPWWPVGVDDDSVQFNKVQFQSGATTAYVASAAPNLYLEDAKGASGNARATGLAKYYPIYLTKDNYVNSTIDTAMSNMGVKNIILLGGYGTFSTTAGLSNNYNVIRAGGVDCNATADYLSRLPSTMTNPPAPLGDSNGIVIQGNIGAYYSDVYNKLISYKNTRDVNYMVNAVSELINNVNIGSDAPFSSSPVVTIGVSTPQMVAYWQCYFSRTTGIYVYQYILPQYYNPPTQPTINMRNTWANTDLNGTITGGYASSGGLYYLYNIDNTGWVAGNSFSIPSNGWHTVQARSVDARGLMSDIVSASGGVDKLPPTLDSYSITNYQYKNGNDYWVIPYTNVNVYTRISDTLSGVNLTYMRNYSFDGTIDNRLYHNWDSHTNSEWMTSPYIKITNATEGYNTSLIKDTTFTIQPQNYEKDYYMLNAAYDYAGNLLDYWQANIGNLRVDATAPTVTSSLTNGILLVNNDSITLTYSDSRSGVATKQWAWTTTPIAPAIWNNYTGPITPTSTGTYYLYYKSMDNVGNTNTNYVGPFTVYDNNLTANSITITDLSGNAVSGDLTQNLSYKAKISLSNTGTTNLPNFVVGLYQNGTSIGTTTVSSLNAGTSTTVNIQFTPTITGSMTYLAKVDDTNAIRESNENDNTVSTRTTGPVTVKTTKSDFTVLLTGGNVQGLSQRDITVTYNPNELDVIDLCTLTQAKELSTGSISGTQITVKSFTPGTIVLTADISITSGNTWDGILDGIRFKSKVSTEVSVTYNVE